MLSVVLAVVKYMFILDRESSIICDPSYDVSLWVSWSRTTTERVTGLRC